jgi:hypothetical protein
MVSAWKSAMPKSALVGQPKATPRPKAKVRRKPKLPMHQAREAFRRVAGQ